MAAVNFELRGYQTAALNSLRSYLRRVIRYGDEENPAQAAFQVQTNAPYIPAPEVGAGVPYICIRIPTGGGKTILAAHAVGVAAREYLQADNPMVLWLVPSTAILDQTLAALRSEDHPYRAALAADFGRNLSVLTVGEALSLSRADATGGACIIVGTIQAFRRDDTSGLNVYKPDNGNLMPHFDGLDASQLARLDRIPGTDVVAKSLANLLRLHRPMVVVDEAHNARTRLSFETLARLDASLIVEWTATPRLSYDAAKDEYPSNVLFHVSAAELKAEDMIKLPIRLNTDRDWLQVMGQARDCRAMLEDAANAERAATGEYIRPIILFQAQSKSATDPDRLTIEKVYGALREAGVPEDQIARHGGGFSELDAIADIASEDCPVRYVITIQKLREGWDCPFAYVLCSVAALTSSTAVEQILGRVLRMPKARRKGQDVLNRAYAFVTSDNFQETAETLKDGLVEGAGFNRLEVKDLVKQFELTDIVSTQTPFTYESEALPEDVAAPEIVSAALGKLPPKLQARVSFAAETRTFSVAGALSSQDRTVLQLAFAPVPGADRVLDRLYRKSNRIAASELPSDLPPFFVPRLAIRHQGMLELFSQDHFLDLPWDLSVCDPKPFAQRFSIDAKTVAGQIDVSEKGAMQIDYIGQLHDQLALAIQEPAWTVPRLVNWIDRGIKHEDVTKPAARIFIHRALEAVMAQKGYTLDQLARYKYEVRRVLAEEIQKHRDTRETGAFAALFPAKADQFVTSAEIEPLLFDEAKYAPTTVFDNHARIFRRHYFGQIGDLKDRGEEYDCALYIDRHPKTEFWVRNLVRKPNTFWLQTAKDKFYPDFVVRLKDGRTLVVEYKGKDRAQLESERDKRIVGETWAEASGGTCLFVMPVARDFAAIDREIDRDGMA